MWIANKVIVIFDVNPKKKKKKKEMAWFILLERLGVKWE